MSKVRYAVIAVLALALIGSVSPAQAGAKTMKVKPYDAQVRREFANAEATAPHGLVVVLSTDGVVTTDQETGAAGPFRDVRGNGTSQITLTNPSPLIDAAGGENASVSLLFSAYKSKLEVKNWWWIDAKGKRIGDKQKG